MHFVQRAVRSWPVAAVGRLRPFAEFGVLPIIEPCTDDLRYIDSYHLGLFAGRHQVDPLDTRVSENILTSLHASGRRCHIDWVTGKSISFKGFCCTCHIESRFEKLMDVSGKPFIVHGIAPP